MRLKPFKLERYFAEFEFSTRYLLCSSDCESLTIGELLALEPEAERAFLNTPLGYTESRGNPGLREAIAGVYSTVSADQVLVHAGAQEAIALFMAAVLNPGDHLIVHQPCYQSLSSVAEVLGAEVTGWTGENFELDPAFLETARKPNTRVVVLNCPHNPTGYLMPAGHYQTVVEFCRRHGLWLFSDEVYRELEYHPGNRLPAACDVYERGVSLGVTSKTYGLPGLRIGWVACQDSGLLETMAALKDYTTICAAAPSEFLATLALRHRDQLRQRSLSLIAANLAVLDGFFGRHSDRFEWKRPLAGPIAFPRLLAGESTSFCQRAVREAGVLLLPSSLYDYPDTHFRIGFGRRNLPEALLAFERFLSVH